MSTTGRTVTTGEVETIGRVIKREREKRGLKVDDVAPLCRITRGQYYQWEQAHRLLKKNIELLAKALEMSEDYLHRVNNGYVRKRTRDGDPERIPAG